MQLLFPRSSVDVSQEVVISKLDAYVLTRLKPNQKCDHPRLVFYTSYETCSVKELDIKACDEDDDDDDDDDNDGGKGVCVTVVRTS